MINLQKLNISMTNIGQEQIQNLNLVELDISYNENINHISFMTKSTKIKCE